MGPETPFLFPSSECLMNAAWLRCSFPGIRFHEAGVLKIRICQLWFSERAVSIPRQLEALIQVSKSIRIPRFGRFRGVQTAATIC